MPVREHASLAIARDWLRLRSRTVYLAGQLVDPARELARWSADLSPAQTDAYFAAKRELHRRFDSQARLGHLFRWGGTAVRLRENVQHFVDAALAAADDPTLDPHTVSARIDQLARWHFDAGSPRPAAAVSSD